MTDHTCGFAGDREETLIAYLYDDIEPGARAAFTAHLPACDRCRSELAALRGVRTQLARWAPPEPVGVLVSDHRPRADRPAQAWATLRDMPAWAQAAAALLVLGVSAGVANLDVRYDQNGLAMRTGWSRPAPSSSGPALPSATGVNANGATDAAVAAPWRADLAALEQQLRAEVQAARAAARSQAAADTRAIRTAASDADVLGRVRALVEESERRQQRELALRVAEVMRDVNTQRQADLVKIDRNLGLLQNSFGVEALKQRQSLNYLMRVNQKQ